MKHEGCQGWGLPLSCKMSVLFLPVFLFFLMVFQIFLSFFLCLRFSSSSLFLMFYFLKQTINLCHICNIWNVCKVMLKQTNLNDKKKTRQHQINLKDNYWSGLNLSYLSKIRAVLYKHDSHSYFEYCNVATPLCRVVNEWIREIYWTQPFWPNIRILIIC